MSEKKTIIDINKNQINKENLKIKMSIPPIKFKKKINKYIFF